MNNGNTNSATVPADANTNGAHSLSTPATAGAGGLGNTTQHQQQPPPPGQQANQPSQPGQQQQQQPPAKGVASTALVTPPTDGEKIDPYDAATRFNAAFLAERKKNEDMAAKLAAYEKAEADKQAKAEQERAALAAKAADEEKAQFAEKKKRMLAVINQAMEGLMKNSGGALSAADVQSVGAPLASSLEKSTTTSELQAIHNGLGPVIELAMKACMGARQMEEANKQRELAAELANLNRTLAQPVPSPLTISGQANFGSSWNFTPPPTFQVPSTPAHHLPPAETTEHKASFNVFDRAPGAPFHMPPAFGSAGVASSTASAAETTSTTTSKAPEPIDLNEPGYAWKLAQEFSTHTPGVLCSEKYVRHGGIEWTEKYVNSNGRVHVQKVPQARRAQLSFKKPLTLRDIDKADFESFVAEINARLKNPNQGAPYKDIVGMTVPSANYADLVKAGLMKRFQPMEGDVGVTMN